MSTVHKQFLKVKNHTYDSPAHWKSNPNFEPAPNSTICQNFLTAIKRNADLDFMAFRAGLSTNTSEMVDQFHYIKYSEAATYVAAIVEQLRSLNFQKEDRVIIYAKNSPLWLFTDLAVQFAGGVTVPIYDTLGVDNIVYCLNLVGAKYVFLSGEFIPNIVGVSDKLQTVKYIISYDQFEATQILAKSKAVFLTQQGFAQKFRKEHSLYSMGSSSASSESTTSVDQDAEIQKFEFGSIESLVNERDNGQIQIKLVELPKQNQQYNLVDPGSENGDICSIMFTSGTSGPPKASIQTHNNIIWGPYSLASQFIPHHARDGSQITFLSYLPLAHIFERALEHYSYSSGMLIYYSSGNIKNLTKDISLARPVIMIGVPRVYAKIYSAVMKQVQEKGIIVQTLFSVGFNIKKFLFNTFPKMAADGRLGIIDKVVFKAIIEKLGGRLQFIVNGSAALNQQTFDFLKICTGAQVTSGYGLTEASISGMYSFGGQFMNSPFQLGWVCKNTDCILIDRSDASEFDLQRDQVGELLIRGPGVVQGFVDGSYGKILKIQDQDGYYHTGDLCRLHADGAVSFVRRVTQVVKLQHGEFIDLEQISEAIGTSPLFICAFVHADADKSAPVCICSVDLQSLQSKLGSDQTLTDLYKNCVDAKGGDQLKYQTKFSAILSREHPVLDTQIQNLLLKEIDTQVRIAGMKGFNVPKAVRYFVNVDWTNDRVLFTPSQKKQHRGFRQMFATEINDMWKEIQICESEHKVKHNENRSGRKWCFVMFGLCALVVGIIAGLQNVKK